MISGARCHRGRQLSRPATSGQALALASLHSQFLAFKEERDKARIHHVDDLIEGLVTQALGKPPNAQIIPVIAKVAAEASRKGHPRAEFLNQMHHGILVNDDILIADVIRTTLGGSDLDKFQQAVNKVHKDEALKANPETASAKEERFYDACQISSREGSP